MMINSHRTMIGHIVSLYENGLKDGILNQVQDDCQISENDHKRRDGLMGRIEHITTQQRIGEWGSINKFANSHGLNPVELLETLRMKEIHPKVLSGLKRRGYWKVLETGRGPDGVSEGLVGKRSKGEN